MCVYVCKHVCDDILCMALHAVRTCMNVVQCVNYDYVCMHILNIIFMHVSVCTCVHVCMHICTYMHACMYVCICISMHVCHSVCVCMYVCMK